MTDDRTLLLRRLDQLEADPRNRGWLAKLRWNGELAMVRKSLAWEDARSEPVTERRQRFRRHMAIGFGGMWLGTLLSSAVIGDTPLGFGRIVRSAVAAGLIFGAGLWWMDRMMRNAWAEQEKEYEKLMQQLRAEAGLSSSSLPHAGQPPTPAAVSPAASAASLPSSR